MPNTKIYLSNLNQVVTEAQLKDHFAEYGEITEIQLPLDKKSRQPKGYALITFAEASSAEKALQQDGKSFLSNNLVVQLATEKSTKK